MERFSYVFKIFKIVKMVCVYSKDNAYIRSEMKKTVEIFACFGYEIVRRADADISADRFKYSADGYSGVSFRPLLFRKFMEVVVVFP